MNQDSSAQDSAPATQEHQWEVTDNQGHSMECTACEETWYLFNEENIDPDGPCQGRPLESAGQDSAN